MGYSPRRITLAQIQAMIDQSIAAYELTAPSGDRYSVRVNDAGSLVTVKTFDYETTPLGPSTSPYGVLAEVVGNSIRLTITNVPSEWSQIVNGESLVRVLYYSDHAYHGSAYDPFVDGTVTSTVDFNLVSGQTYVFTPHLRDANGVDFSTETSNPVVAP